MELWKGRQKENKKRKRNRKKRRILKQAFWGNKQDRKKLWNCRKIALLGLCAKQKHKNTEKQTKPSKKPKNTFSQFGKQPPIFGKFLFFSNYTLSCLQSCVCRKHYKNSAFSSTQLLAITNSKAPFEAPSQNGTFSTKSAILGFPCACWNPYFLCLVTLNGQKKGRFPQTDSCNENERFFNLPNNK